MSGNVVQVRPTVGYSFERLAVTTAVQVLTPSKYETFPSEPGALSAYLTIEGGGIRFTYDGTTPSNSVGHLLPDGGSLRLTSIGQIEQFKCYSLSNPVILSITYERE